MFRSLRKALREDVEEIVGRKRLAALFRLWDRLGDAAGKLFGWAILVLWVSVLVLTVHSYGESSGARKMKREMELNPPDPCKTYYGRAEPS